MSWYSCSPWGHSKPPRSRFGEILSSDETEHALKYTGAAWDLLGTGIPEKYRPPRNRNSRDVLNASGIAIRDPVTSILLEMRIGSGIELGHPSQSTLLEEIKRMCDIVCNQRKISKSVSASPLDDCPESQRSILADWGVFLRKFGGRISGATPGNGYDMLLYLIGVLRAPVVMAVSTRVFAAS